MLNRHRDRSLTLFAVWEPMLTTDFGKPSTPVLQRLQDRRVRQFWDPNHLVAGILHQAHLQADCCIRKGILWDLIAVWNSAATWPDSLSAPLLFNGTMVKNADTLDKLLSADELAH